MRQTLIGIALTALSAAAIANSTDPFLFNTTGSIKSSSSYTTPEQAAFGSTPGTSGAVITTTFGRVAANADMGASFGTIDATQGLKPGFVVTGHSEASWSGDFRNTFTDKRSFSVTVFTINDTFSQNLSRDPYGSIFLVDGVAHDLTGSYLQESTFELGALAPGQSVKLGMSLYANIQTTVQPDGTTPVWSGAQMTLEDFTSTPLAAVSPVPEPANYAMFAAGLALLAWRRRTA